ncbi:MAG: lipopolysaccharide biosynthesis protein [Candidatus Saccharimonadales bacterium]
MNRKVASAKTALSGILLNAVTAVLGFIAQKIFISTLGVEYAGVNGVFASVVSILTLTDLGISTAVTFHLYKPLAEKNHAKIAALMHYYHKACRIISLIIIVGGLILIPFAPAFVGETTVPDNLYIIFGLFIANAVFSYTLNYRRPLLGADQKGFITNIVITICSIILYVSKIIVLVTTKNFYLYTLCTVLAKIIEDTIINIVVKKRYPYIAKPSKLNANTKTDLKKKMYGSIYHNAASYVVFSTDNIIISQIFGVISVGLYSNYHMVLNSLNLLFSQLFGAMTASLGNILAGEGPKRLYLMAKRIMLLNFWVYVVVSIAAYFCITPFIKLWLGEDYLFIDAAVIALILNFYLQAVRLPINSILSSAGVIYENRYVPVAEAIINLVASVVLALWLGLPGVFIGTALSNLFLHIYSYPKYAFQMVLKRKKSEYILLFLKYFGLFIATWIAMGGIMQFINISNSFVEFLVKGILSVVIPSVAYLIIFHRTEEFKYFTDIVSGGIKKLLKRR